MPDDWGLVLGVEIGGFEKKIDFMVGLGKIFCTILLILKSVYKNTSLGPILKNPLFHRFKPPPPLYQTKSTENCYFPNFSAQGQRYNEITKEPIQLFGLKFKFP